MSEYKTPDTDHLVEEPDPQGTYTASDYLSWSFEWRAELIHGKYYKMLSAPRWGHQELVSRLHLELGRYFKGKKCKVGLSPTDVYLIHQGEDYRQTKNVVQPDLFVVCDASKVRSIGCVGAPDFVIEVLSPSTSKRDASDKRDLYQEYGVPEYWMIQETDRLVIINRLDAGGEYITQGPYTVGQVVSPSAFPELVIDLTELFRDIKQDSAT